MFQAGMYSRTLHRYFHTTLIRSAVDKSLLSKLRKKTGFPFVKCKNALQQFENDILKAEMWLKEQAQKEGWAKATKLQGRPMSQGLVAIMVDQNNAAMVEVNCETDFVARNSKFHGLVSKVTTACLDWGKERTENKIFLGSHAIKDIPSDGKTLADLLALEIGNIGENMALRRAVLYRVIEDSKIGTYVHSVGTKKSDDSRCRMGKFGAMITFSQLDTSSLPGDEAPLSSTEFGRQLCQHIVGINPSKIGSVHEKPNENKEEEKSMVHQEFLLDADLTVSEFLSNNRAIVHDFIRFECGEELATDDIPQEVYVSHPEQSTGN